MISILPSSPKDPPVSVLTDTSRSSSVVSELQATPSMCHHCFDVLIEALQASHNDPNGPLRFLLPSSTKKPEFVQEIPPGESECPLFVTWDKKRHPHNHPKFELRGCIGTHSPKPLATSVGEYAKIAALKDKRFHPISLDELPLLRVAVSLLIRYEPCEHCHDWTVGLHGVIIGWVDESSARGGREYSAT
jgi:AMME syndrome candidate gene 1 protein